MADAGQRGELTVGRPTSGFAGAAKALAQKQVLVTVRMVLHRRDNVKSTLGIERRSLETEGHENHLQAAPPARLLLRRTKQSRPQTLFATRLVNPELANFRASAPGIAADPGYDPIVIVPHKNREPLAVGDARCDGVELVEAILQILNLTWCWLSADDEFRRAHCLYWLEIRDLVEAHHDRGQFKPEILSD